jgi:DNA-binding transcriptional ArsR family regulator
MRCAVATQLHEGIYFYNTRNMESMSAVAALSALAHEGRLSVFRLLVQAGSSGMPAGEIARRLAVLPNTLSANLKVLSHAGMVRSRREGRSIVYAADYEAMRGLLIFLVEDCCQGSAEVCAPLALVASKGCAAEGSCA